MRKAVGLPQISASSSSSRTMRRFHTFNLIDDFNRKALRIGIYTSLPALRERVRPDTRV